jgi:hypothetical protein
MTCIDKEQAQWYCYRDDQVYFAKEDRWQGFEPEMKQEMKPLLDRHEELMLAQTQGVLMKGAGVKKMLEGGFGGERVGTLVLTNKRLIFVSTNTQTERYHGNRSAPGFSVTYSEVEDLASIPQDPGNLFIDLGWISKVSGHKAGITRSSLEVTWHQFGFQDETRVFVQRITTGISGKRDLGDWAPEILHLKDGTRPLFQTPPLPEIETLEGKTMRVLGDMEKKGFFTIERRIREEFNVRVDPDELDAALATLCEKGLLKRDGTFYQKSSPLGTDEFSH